MVRSVVDVARDESITFLAAAVAYYGFVSIVPLLVLAVVVATTVGGEGFAELVIALLEEFLTETAQSSLRQALQPGMGTGAGSATVVSVLLLGWSGLKVFRALDRAFSEVYGTTDADDFLQDVRDAVVALSTIGVAVTVVAVLGVVVQGVAGPLAAVLGVLLVPGTLVVAFLPLYYVFPDADLSIRAVLPGAVTAALGWWALAWGFGIYAEFAGSTSLYGVLGTALLLVTWLYFGAILVILGAIVNVVVGGDRGEAGAGQDRQLQHP